MKKQKHELSGLWGNYPTYLTNEHTNQQVYPIGKHLAEMLTIGPFYYYTINISDYSLYHVNSAMLSIHGIKELPETLQQIIDLIHPEDLDFVIAAEQATLEKIKGIGLRHQLNLKTSYCFRMRVADGSYHLFHHQVVLLAENDEGDLTTVLHIHTDMQHITRINNKIIVINRIGKLNYWKMDLSEESLNIPIPKLSKREIEVLTFLAQGLSSQQIGEKLFISKQTVRVHRKHLLKKTQTSNSSYLIKKCTELSLI